MTFDQALLILLARWRLSAWIFGLIVGAVVIINLLLPKEYVSTASVVLNIKPDPVAAAPATPDLLAAYTATQVEIMSSSRASRRVVDMMQLAKDHDWHLHWMKATKGRGDEREWIAERLSKKLKVVPNGLSNIINISVTWDNPKTAATIANAFATAYLEIALELKVDPANQYAAAFKDRAEALRADLEAKQKLLSDFESKAQIVATDERLDVENSRLAELSTQLVNVQAQRQESESRRREAAGDIYSSPEVLQSPTIAALKAQLSTAEARLADLSTRLGTSNPQYESAAAEVAGIKARMAAETANIVGSLSTMSRVNAQREKDLIAAVEAQKRRILELKHQHDKAQILQNDVLTAQRNLDAVTQHLAQSSLEGAASQTEAALLAPAVEPLDYAYPKILLNCLLAALAGLITGIAAALMREQVDRRVRSSEALEVITDAPVLGKIGYRLPVSAIATGGNRLLTHN